MADPRTLLHDTLSQRWDTVTELTYCPRCRGTLPPDTEAACQECGTRTPPGLPPVPLLIEEPKLTEEETAEPVPPQPAEPIGWTTMLKSWARWPNAMPGEK